MTARLLVKRAITIVAGLFFVVLAFSLYWMYAVDRAGFQHWRRFGYMAAINADLSKPGEYSVSFEACDIDPVLELEVPKRVASRISPEELLSGLQGTCELIDPRGEVVYAPGSIPQDTPRFYPRGSGRILLVEYGY